MRVCRGLESLRTSGLFRGHVKGNRVFLMDRPPMKNGKGDGTGTLCDRKNGKKIWEFIYPAEYKIGLR